MKIPILLISITAQITPFYVDGNNQFLKSCDFEKKTQGNGQNDPVKVPVLEHHTMKMGAEVIL
jgi:hypothetical protein